MAFSSVLGASSVIKPGVVTTATRPSSPFVGQLIYDTTLSQTLAYNGSAWIVQTGGLVLVKTQTIGTAVSSVTVSDAFSSTYDNYRIIINGGASSASIEDLNMTLGSTSTGYYWAQNGRTYANVDSPGASANGTSWRAGNTSSDAINMCADVFSPFLADQTSFSTLKSFAATNGAFYSGGGYLNNATSYTAFTLTVGSGTITGGTIRVYGYANS